MSIGPETGDDPRRTGALQATLDQAAAARAEAIPSPPARPGSVTTDLSDAPTGNCVLRPGRNYTERELAWRPDPNSHSARAESWRQAHEQLKNQPLDTDGNGMYTVKNGDDLSTIAMRSLRDQGQQVSAAAIHKEEARIIGLNRDALPDLAKNVHLIHDGDKLRLTDCQGMPPVQIETPQSRPAALPPEQQPRRNPGPDHYGDDGDVSMERPPLPAAARGYEDVSLPPPEVIRPGYSPDDGRPAPVYVSPESVQPGYPLLPGFFPPFGYPRRAYYPPPGYGYDQPVVQSSYGYGNPAAAIFATIAAMGLGAAFGRRHNYYGGGYCRPHHRRRPW